MLLVTGLWLILFYRVGAPWESVARLTADPWLGNWVRGLHRYASDLAVVATAVHAFRMFAQGRSWGARALAWMTGCLLLLLLFICGWTGYVMVWDTFGEHLAREGARMLDTLPFLSEPTSRAFTGEQPVPTVFFFLNLFAHIGIPLAMGVVFWLHVKRLAAAAHAAAAAGDVAGRRRAHRDRHRLAAGDGAAGKPVRAAGERPGRLLLRLLDAARAGPERRAGAARRDGLRRWRSSPCPGSPRVAGDAAPAPSVVDEDICVGCVQCSIDCPYGAITMFERVSRRSDLVARVDPDLCVSCGICAGSCAPMGVGPPGRAGRDQIAAVREFVAAPQRRAGEIVVICCDHGAGEFAADVSAAGGVPYPIDCAGNLHTSVIEMLLRGGAGGVLVLACPDRDCWNREGPRWLGARVHGTARSRAAAQSRARPGPDRARRRARTRPRGSTRCARLPPRSPSLGPPAEADAAEADVQCEPALVERDA